MELQKLKGKESRYSREPVRRKDGKLKRLKLQHPAYLQTLLICHEYLASVPYIAALTNRSVEHTRRSLKEFKRPPNELVALCDTQQEEYSSAFLDSYQIFTLTERGRDAVINRNLDLPLRFPRSNSIKHDVFSHNGIMSLEIGAKQHGIGLIKGAEVFEHLPDGTKDKPYWWNFPLQDSKIEKTHVEPDYFPIGIDRSESEDPLFLAFEFERDAERRPRATVYKIKDWLDVLKNKIYKKHMGLPNLYPTFITRAITAKQKILQQIKEHVPRPYQSYFLVKAQWQDEPRASGWMLEEDFETALGTFNLLTMKVLD